MPERARVFVAEDNPQWQMLIERFLTRAGHSIVLRADNLTDAINAIDQFEQLGVQIATLDGNLTHDDDSGNDGRALVAAINRHAPNVKTVGLSGIAMEDVTVDVGKKKIEELGQAIINL